MGQDLKKWADRAMYESKPIEGGLTVRLLNATPDPLGTIAAMVGMYTGKVTYDLRELDQGARQIAFRDMMKTELNGALESVSFLFLIEGVTRAFTHQMVRTRSAFFAQESLRFAVVDDWAERVPLPPSITEPAPWHGGSPDSPGAVWYEAIEAIGGAYNKLIDAGVPAEDARGLMPHSITTRIMMSCSLRTLLDMAGKRLCTQAQFEWRQVMAKMVLAVRGYRVRPGWDKHHTSTWWHPCGVQYQTEYQLNRHRETCDLWQFKEIAKALQPVCYQKGACGFMASMDRGCSIRSRVDANERIGRPSSEWAEEKTIGPADVVQLGMPTFPWVKQTPRGDFNFIPAIDPAEWAADPTAARHDGGGFVGEG